jgi:DNA repair exonuclease SbcCD ATPase subunit|tara:strand:+ start:11 stop:2338 length:2328 start_codon:yes stop_codon:yes gene_type:complete
MEIDKLENPFIKVTWDDIPENFTQERIKRVRSYFQNKYNSKNVTVLTRAIDRNSGNELDIDLDQNVMDTTYQRNLMSQFVMANDMGVDINLIKRLDDKVNAKIADEVEIDTKYKRVYVKKIKFSNFLSFGDNNVLDVEKLGGITVIDSNPPNFGGKSVLAVDLILFLFFNTTTKTSKAIDIFNRFRKVNEVFVQGEVEIDGGEYIIVRKIKRKKTKKGEWSVSTSLEFLERKKDGSLQNFTGEQRRETEKFIKESIGTMNDFLLTVLSTAGNLESLIESKPTERGNVLSRFIGLEVLKDKESTCKKMYSEWSKKLISNVYNIEELKQDIKKEKQEKITLSEKNVDNQKKLNKVETELVENNKTRDELIGKKFLDIDIEIQKVNPRLVKESLDENNLNLLTLDLKLKAYGDKEIPEEVDLEVLSVKTKDRDKTLHKKIQNTTNLKSLNKTLKNLIESEICPTCKQPLKDVDHTPEIESLKKEISTLNTTIENEETKLIKLNEVVENITTKKIIFDDYEKELLKKERVVLEIGKKELEINKIKEKLKKWESNKNKLEENANLDKKILTTDSKLDVLKSDKDNLIREIEGNTNKIKNSEDLIVEHNIKISKIKKENEVEEVFRAYLTVFGKNGIIKTIVKSVVPKLNSELMRLLSDVTNFMTEIRVNDKNEVEFWMVDNDTGVEKLLVTGSGFEKTLASLAIRTVLTKVSCLPRPNITVFDEVLGKVSNENLEQVGTFFSRVKDYFENVFLITHNPLVREWSDNVVTINKENNISKLR